MGAFHSCDSFCPEEETSVLSAFPSNTRNSHIKVGKNEVFGGSPRAIPDYDNVGNNLFVCQSDFGGNSMTERDPVTYKNDRIFLGEDIVSLSSNNITTHTVKSKNSNAQVEVQREVRGNQTIISSMLSFVSLDTKPLISVVPYQSMETPVPESIGNQSVGDSILEAAPTYGQQSVGYSTLEAVPEGDSILQAVPQYSSYRSEIDDNQSDTQSQIERAYNSVMANAIEGKDWY